MKAVSRILEVGCRGEDVRAWQRFLCQQNAFSDFPDGVFGVHTLEATQRFQRQRGLPSDGRVGLHTRQMALQHDLAEPPGPTETGFFPPLPDFSPLTGTEQRAALFGRFDWEAAPTPDNPERIRVSPEWGQQNLVLLEVPQLAGIPLGCGGAAPTRIRIHRRAADPWRRLWAAWAGTDLLPLILTYDGDYAPRLQRGSHTVLSAHAFGTAFDINARWNPLGHTPANVSTRGSVVRLVALANAQGFHWGGPASNGELFRKIVEAYEVLREPLRRAAYDAECRSSVSAPAAATVIDPELVRAQFINTIQSIFAGHPRVTHEERRYTFDANGLTVTVDLK